MAKKIKRTNQAGVFIQLLGLLMGGAGFLLGGIGARGTGLSGFLLIIGVITLLLGGMAARGTRMCSECRNPVDKESRLCPTCKAQFDEPSGMMWT